MGFLQSHKERFVRTDNDLDHLNFVKIANSGLRNITAIVQCTSVHWDFSDFLLKKIVYGHI